MLGTDVLLLPGFCVVALGVRQPKLFGGCRAHGGGGHCLVQVGAESHDLGQVLGMAELQCVMIALSPTLPGLS